LSFLKKEYHVPGYGSLPEKVAFITLLAGFISVEALFWHVWFWAGIVFLPFAFALLTISSFYKFFVVFPKHFSMPEPDKASEKQSEENTP
jgi:hypothetical protein